MSPREMIMVGVMPPAVAAVVATVLWRMWRRGARVAEWDAGHRMGAGVALGIVVAGAAAMEVGWPTWPPTPAREMFFYAACLGLLAAVGEALPNPGRVAKLRWARWPPRMVVCAAAAGGSTWWKARTGEWSGGELAMWIAGIALVMSGVWLGLERLSGAEQTRRGTDAGGTVVRVHERSRGDGTARRARDLLVWAGPVLVVTLGSVPVLLFGAATTTGPKLAGAMAGAAAAIGAAALVCARGAASGRGAGDLMSSGNGVLAVCLVTLWAQGALWGELESHVPGLLMAVGVGAAVWVSEWKWWDSSPERNGEEHRFASGRVAREWLCVAAVTLAAAVPVVIAVAMVLASADMKEYRELM